MFKNASQLGFNMKIMNGIDAIEEYCVLWIEFSTFEVKETYPK